MLWAIFMYSVMLRFVVLALQGLLKRLSELAAPVPRYPEDLPLPPRYIKNVETAIQVLPDIYLLIVLVISMSPRKTVLFRKQLIYIQHHNRLLNQQCSLSDNRLQDLPHNRLFNLPPIRLFISNHPPKQMDWLLIVGWECD
jgi:hypothetical protein